MNGIFPIKNDFCYCGCTCCTSDGKCTHCGKPKYNQYGCPITNDTCDFEGEKGAQK